MKRSEVFEAITHQASDALTNPYADNVFETLLEFRSLVSRLFGFKSPEYLHLDLYVDSAQGVAFVGPLFSRGAK